MYLLSFQIYYRSHGSRRSLVAKVNYLDSTWSWHKTTKNRIETINHLPIETVITITSCFQNLETSLKSSSKWPRYLVQNILHTSSTALVTFSLTGKPLPCTAVWRSAPYSTDTYNKRVTDHSHNDVKCGFEMLHEIWLALEKCRANQT